MSAQEGGCLCGNVRYEMTADPVATVVCHCTHCQKSTGTSFSLAVLVPNDGVTVEGRLKTFHDKGESGQEILRQFCPECGSPVTTLAASLPGMTIIKAGTFDDTSWLSPSVEIYCESAESWLPRFEGLAAVPRALPG